MDSNDASMNLPVPARERRRQPSATR